MLTSLQIQNFKCFRDLQVAPLAKVNLFVGAGNSGKTALLEAISWLPQQTSGELPGFFDFRDQSCTPARNQEFQRWLFYQLDQTHDIRVSAGRNGTQPNTTLEAVVGRRHNTREYTAVREVSAGTLNWTPAGNGRHPVIRTVNTDILPANELARKYDRWTLETENETSFLDWLKAVEPRLRSLRPMEPHGQRMIYADIGLRERVPLPLLGEGFNRLIQIAGAIVGEGADIVLIDEIENGLHWKALPQVWTGLKAAVAASGAQIFATTHSYECIKAAVEVFQGEPRGELAVHRLERGADGEIRCVTMEEAALEQAMEENWEIR